MNENAYASPELVDEPTKKRATWLLIWLGLAFLGVAVLCAVLTVALMILGFYAFPHAPDLKPDELATGMSFAVIPSYGVYPFGVVGLVLVIVGVFRRRPVARQNRQLGR